MEPFRYHVYFCNQKKPEGAPSCPAAGAIETLAAFRQHLVEKDLTEQVQVTTCGCLGICQKGPNMVVYPDGVWYSGLNPENIKQIVDAHLVNHTPVTDLAIEDVESTRQEIIEHNNRVAFMRAVMAKSGMVPEELNSYMRGFMESRAMLTAVELDIFSAVGNGATADDVASNIKAHPRSTEALLNALASMEVLDKENDVFKNRPLTARFLAKGGEFDSRSASMHAVGLWHSWSTLTDCVKKGTSVRQEKGEPRSEESTKAFIAAMHKNASFRAGRTIDFIDLNRITHVLDLGGGSGAYAIAFAKKNPEMKCTVFDLPSVIPLTKEYVSEAGVADQVDYVSGDMSQDDLGSGYDLVWISAICHMWGEAENQDLIQRSFQSLNPGGQIVIQDFILSDDKISPRAGAVFALNMLVNTKTGSSYSLKEYTEWITAAGFTDVEHKTMPGPTGLVIGRKTA